MQKDTYALLLDVRSMKNTIKETAPRLNYGYVSVNFALSYSLAHMVRIVCPLQSSERYANASYLEGLLARAPTPITSRQCMRAKHACCLYLEFTSLASIPA